MRRRHFITMLGGAAAWPVVLRAQQSTVPVIGYLHSASPEPYSAMIAAFRQGLAETGHIEGETVRIDYRWADGQFNRLPSLVAELLTRRPALLVAGGGDVSRPRHGPRRPLFRSVGTPCGMASSAISAVLTAT